MLTSVCPSIVTAFTVSHTLLEMMSEEGRHAHTGNRGKYLVKTHKGKILKEDFELVIFVTQ